MTVRILALAVLLVVPVTDLARAADRGHPKVELLKVLNRLMLPLTTDPGVGRAWHLDVVGEVDGNKGSVELAWDGRARHYLRVGGDDLPGVTAVFGASRSSLWVPAHGKLFTASHAPVDATTLLADEKAWRALLRQAPVLAGVGALLLLPSDLDMTLDDDGTLEAAVADEFALRIRRGAKSGALTLELRLGTSSETIARIDVRKCSRVPVAEFDKLLAAAPVAGDGAAVEEVDIVHLRGMLRTLGDLGAEKLLARINPKLVPDPLADVPRVDGVPFVRLDGTPEEMGKRHGEVLRDGVHYNVHRTLHGVGFLATVSTGKWFPGELARAWSATERFIPKRHVREIDATSAAAGLPRDWGRHLSVFPEIFHCSGIAVRGKATVDGKIYHGRVLDYMTHIGLHATPSGRRTACVDQRRLRRPVRHGDGDECRGPHDGRDGRPRRGLLGRHADDVSDAGGRRALRHHEGRARVDAIDAADLRVLLRPQRRADAVDGRCRVVRREARGRAADHGLPRHRARRRV